MKKILQLAKKTYPYIKPYMFENIVNFICSQISVILTLCIPLAIKYLIDDIITEKHWEKVPHFVIIMIVIYVVNEIVNIVSGYMYAKLSETIYSDARTSLYEKLMKKELAFIDKTSEGDIISRLMNDSGYLHTMLSYIIGQFLVDGFRIIAVFVILFSMNFIFAFIALLTVPIFLWLNKKYGKKLKDQVTISRNYNTELTNFYINSFKNIKLIKNFNNEEAECKKNKELNTQIKKIQISTEFTGYFTHSMMEICTNINQLIILCAGTYAIYYGNLTVGGLIAFNSYLSHIYNPFLNITNTYTLLNKTIVCVERFFEYNNEDQLEDFHLGENHNIHKGNIIFSNVDFSYKNELILKDASFIINDSDKVLLKGKSGSGKSTIFSILKRFYSINSGTVYIDGKDINKINLRDLREQIYYLSQENGFFECTIRENFKRINDDLSEDEIWTALYKAKIDEVIKKPEHEGLDTMLFKNANNFSAGQRQRLNLARLFVQNQKIVILDEPFTGIDQLTVEDIWLNMKSFLQDRTVIFVDHNFEDKLYFNKNLKLENGIIEYVK